MSNERPHSPLAEQLGLKPGARTWLAHAPAEWRTELTREITGIEELAAPSAGIDVAILCANDSTRRDVRAVAELLQEGGVLWVIWPAEPDEDAADLARSAGLVPVASCMIGGRHATKLTRHG